MRAVLEHLCFLARAVQGRSAAPYARLGWWLVAGTGALGLGLIIALVCAPSSGPERTLVPSESNDPWTHLLVCANCGYRLRCSTHPGLVLQRRGPNLKCPTCGAWTAAAYRRGGMALPPGGWPASSPAAGTRETGATP